MNQAFRLIFKSRFGEMELAATARGLYSLAFRRRREERGAREKIPGRVASLLHSSAIRIRAFLAGQRVDLRHLPVDWRGSSPFERKVLERLRQIPRGQTKTYGALARWVGKPGAARAVGQVLHKNRLPFVIPCHRILPQSGGVGRFSKGPRLKKELLKLEGAWADTKLKLRRP